MSKFEHHLKSLLDNKSTITGDRHEKLMSKCAATTAPTNVTVESLRKIATILRNTEAEPSYTDLATFVDRIV